MHSRSEIITALQAGQPVIVLDAADRENEADLIIPASAITVDQVAFLIRYTSGIICVAMTEARLAALGLHRLESHNTSHFNTPFTMPVDYKPSTIGGVSALERHATIKALIDPKTDPADLGRPGHVFPLIAAAGGLATRPGHTEAGVRLMELSGLYPAAVLGEMMNDDGTMMRGQQLETFAQQHNLLMCTISDMMTW